MRETTSISLPKGFKSHLGHVAKVRGLTMSEVIREALRQYLLREEFHELRRVAISQAYRQGHILSDQEVFEKVS